MKGFLSLFLAALLLAAPVWAMAPAAEQTALDAQLTEVTLQVKNTLDVPDDFTDFRGDYDDYLAGQWYLYWSAEDRELSVTASADGKVMELYLYDYGTQTEDFYGFDPAFPSLSRTEAEQTALAWLERVLGPEESARMDSVRVSLDAGDDLYRFSGTVCLYGLPSPISFSLRLNGQGEVTGFSRSDSYGGYLGTVSEPEDPSDEQAALAALTDEVEMELYWVLDGEEAALRYVPCWPRTVVEAETGKVVDMEALYESFESSYNMAGGMVMETAEAEAPAAMDNSRGLTEVELQGIENYADALAAGELDALLRAMEALGLDEGFELKNTDYTVDAGTGDIRASLRYGKTMTEDELYGYSREEYRQALEWGQSMNISKYITVDAKTGELLSVSTSYPLWEKDGGESLKEKELESIAADFLQAVAPEYYELSARCDLRDYADGLVWCQLYEGYFFPENRLTVTLNAATGCVDSYFCQWQEDVSFGSTDILSGEEAAELYAEGMELVLGYTAWPEELDERDPLMKAYIDWGYTWIESLRAVWYFEDWNEVTAVDAVSGELIRSTAGETGDYVYEDLEDCSQRSDIEALAEAGIGLSGGRFEPEAALDQRTAVILLLQADGYRLAGQWDDERLKENAVYRGFVSAEAWDPDASMTRMDFLRALLGASRYGAAAELSGIWTAEFEDSGSVAPEDEGYAALARALGAVTEETLRPDDVCTRAEAAGMLAGFMRK